MKIKLAILDIDGVMTDGKKTYDVDGNVMSKTYCDKDFTAIKRLRASGVKVCFLSGDNRINEAMAKNRNIDFYYARGKNKADFVSDFVRLYEVASSDMLYIGDDLFDESIMKVVGHRFCPADAALNLRKICGPSNTMKNNGGNNVVAEMVEILLERGLMDDCTMEQIEQLDKKEIF